MDGFTQFDVAESLVQLQNGTSWHYKREEELQNVETPPNFDFEDEVRKQCSMFLSIFQNDDPEFIKKLTNFSVQAVGTVWDLIKENVENKVLCGRGSKSRTSAKDHFLAIRVLKHGGSWQFHATVFKQKVARFERLLSRFF